MEMIKAAGLKKYYVTDNYEVHALDGVSLSVEEGEFLAIIGTSGSGKTTLLQILGGLDEPTAGGVWIRGNSLKDMTEDERTIFRRRNIGFVFQQYNLIPVINVYENIVLPLRLDGEGEAGIFYIARSDLMQKNADYIRGNRIMFGSISVILLCVGLVNYFNIMFTGIVGRKKELEIMRKIGMTRRQERKLLLLEGSYYVLLIAGLVASVGSIILKGINVYMRKQLSYFTFHYPVGAIAGSIVIMEIVCVIICNLLILKKMKK